MLAAEGCECTLNGLYLANGEQFVDNHTRIDHARPHCTSHEFYKGILDGKARGVFNGKIFVHPDAQKTDARQTNKTLLLSDDAMIDAKPQLEIYADDVKCTHGATIGQLDDEAIFYLRIARTGSGCRPPDAHLRVRQRCHRPGADRIAPCQPGGNVVHRGRRSGRLRRHPMSKLQTPARAGARRGLERPFDVDRVRADFPALKQKVYGQPLVYLDNAATTQKPQSVLDAEARFYTHECANVHRAVHILSERATHDYEEARVKVQHFLNAADNREIIFVRGATEGINLVAQSFGRKHVAAGDEIIVSAMEHHSNIVPWQMLCEERGARPPRCPDRR